MGEASGQNEEGAEWTVPASLLKAGWDHACTYPPVTSAEPGQHSKTEMGHLEEASEGLEAELGPGSVPILW